MAVVYGFAFFADQTIVLQVVQGFKLEVGDNPDGCQTSQAYPTTGQPEEQQGRQAHGIATQPAVLPGQERNTDSGQSLFFHAEQKLGLPEVRLGEMHKQTAATGSGGGIVLAVQFQVVL